MDAEISALRRSVTNKRWHSGHPWRILEGKISGKHILLVRTGIGKSCAQRAAEFTFKHYPVNSVISLGFSGALAEGLEIGTLVLCQTLFHNAYPADDLFYSSDTGLIVQAINAANGPENNLLTGNSLTTDGLVTQPDEKAALGMAYRALVVDMESYHIARIASRHRIPFLAVRAVSDTLGERLPPFTSFIKANDTWLWKEALRHFLTTPGDLIKIPTIFIHAQKAKRRLTSFIKEFLS